MSRDELEVAALAAALGRLLPPGSTLDALGPRDVTVVDVGAGPADVLVRFRWKAYPYLLGHRLGPDVAYLPVETAPDWADQARMHLVEELGTGLVARAVRREGDGFIELTATDLPDDRRFHVDALPPGDDPAWEGVRFVERDGLDTSVPRARRRAGTLVSWHRASVNDERGAPFVGHVTVTRVDAGTALLEQCETSPGVPASVVLGLCHRAAHAASWAGATRVVTDVDHPALGILGFTHADTDTHTGTGTHTGTAVGRRELDTRFLSVDADAARQLLDAEPGWDPSALPRRTRSTWFSPIRRRS